MSAAELTADTFPGEFASALRQRLNGRRGAAKIIARAGRCGITTAKEVLAGRRNAQAVTVLHILREFPEVADQFLARPTESIDAAKLADIRAILEGRE